MFYIDDNTSLGTAEITAYISAHITDNARMARLARYYAGQHDILTRTLSDSSKPNNRLVSSYPRYITDLITGYFAGSPITWQADDGGDVLLSVAQPILDKADDALLSRDASIFGVAYELAYLDEKAQLNLARLEPTGIIPLYTPSIQKQLRAVIRYFDLSLVPNTPAVRYVEVYLADRIDYYQGSTGGDINYISSTTHPFAQVPISVYENNDEEKGDYEPVISLIDAYDCLMSDSLNELSYFGDAYLALKGVEGTSTDDIAAMKETRVLLLPQDAEASWLLKQIDGAYVQDLRNTLDRNIHKLSLCPAMTDQDFASNASGVAMKYKLLGLESLVSKKERAYRKGLDSRIKLIVRIQEVLGSDYDASLIHPIFTRSLPVNDAEIADTLNKLRGFISTETAISQIPWVEDPVQEMERLQAEKSLGYSDPAPQVMTDGNLLQ